MKLMLMVKEIWPKNKEVDLMTPKILLVEICTLKSALLKQNYPKMFSTLSLNIKCLEKPTKPLSL